VLRGGGKGKNNPKYSLMKENGGGTVEKNGPKEKAGESTSTLGLQLTNVKKHHHYRFSEVTVIVRENR